MASPRVGDTEIPRGPAPARRGVWAAALAATGILLAPFFAERGISGAAALSAAIAMAMLALVCRGHAARITLGAAIVVAGIGWCAIRTVEYPRSHIARFLADEPSMVRIVGVLASVPEPRPRAAGALAEFSWERGEVMRMEVEAVALEDRHGARTPVTGRIWVRVSDEIPGWRIGDGLRITGMGRGVGGPRNPGEPDWAAWARARGIGGTVRVDDASLITPFDPAFAALHRIRWTIERWLGESRARARAVFQTDQGADEDTRALLGALVLGAREQGYDDVDRTFRRIGLSHVVAISGLHVSLLAGALVLLVRVTGDRPRVEALALALAVALMLVVVPARSPVLRAVLIVVALRAGALAGRRWDGLNMLGWVAVAVLAWQPTEVWNPGFQLSFGIVGAMIWLVRPVTDRMLGRGPDPDHRTPAQWMLRWTTDMVVAGCVAWAVSAPAIAAHFGNISPATPILTILVLPVMLVAVVAGYAAVFAELVLGGWGGVVAPIALASGSWLMDLVRAMERIPGTWINAGWVGGAWAIAATALVIAWLWRGRWRSWPLWAATALVVAWLSWDLAGKGAGRGVALRVDAIDVGDGSAYLLRAGREAVLFDCGSRWFGIGERTIPDAVRALRSPRVGTVIISHHDTDHFSGLIDAEESLGVRRVIVTPQFLRGVEAAPRGPGAATLAHLRARGIAIETVAMGDSIALGDGISLRILWPPGDDEALRDNDASIVAIAEAPTAHGPRRVLLTGDIERDAVERLEALYPDLRADIMEAPHHGSARAFASRFVMAIDPAIVIQSSGPARLGDERWDKVKDGRTWLMTAEVGAVAAEIRADGSVRGWGFLRR